MPEINNNHYLLVQTHIEIYDLMHLTNKKLKHLKKQTLSILHLKWNYVKEINYLSRQKNSIY